MKTDNEVLAEFMGEIVYNNEAEMRLVPIEELKPYFFESQLSYDTSFDWLMPVWYKFRDLKLELTLGQYKTYIDYWDRIANDIPRKDIAEVCKLLAKGIRWYNEIKK